MIESDVKALEVRPVNAGIYRVAVYWYSEAPPLGGRYSILWASYDGAAWVYATPECYVCFIYERLDDAHTRPL